MNAKSFLRCLGTVIFSIGLLQVTACTSSKSKDNQDKQEIATSDDFQQEGADDFDSPSSGDSSSSAGNANAEADPFSSDLNAGAGTIENDLNASTNAAPTGKDELTLDEGGGDFPSAPLDNGAVAEAPAPSPNDSQNIAPSDDALFNPPPAQPPVEPSAGATSDDLAAPIAAGIADESKPAKKRTSGGSLRKVADVPFKSGQTILNRVYLARSGDNFKSVSQKIYGKDRSKDLKKWNSSLAGAMKTGDKVYYNSPKSPDDEASMQTYFEENGIASSSYTTKEGDDLKVLAKQLIGARESWKELWATNPGLVEKGALPPDQEIRYWSSDAAASAGTDQKLANDLPMKEDLAALPQEPILPPPADPAVVPPPTQDLAALQPPPDAPPASAPNAATGTTTPPPPDAALTTPPPPSMDPAAAAAPAQPPPPPVDPQVQSAQQAAAQPPEVKPEKKKPRREPPPVEAEDDLTMQLGIAVLVIFAAVGGIVVMRKRRMAKQIDLGHTQV